MEYYIYYYIMYKERKELMKEKVSYFTFPVCVYVSTNIMFSPYL